MYLVSPNIHTITVELRDELLAKKIATISDKINLNEIVLWEK